MSITNMLKTLPAMGLGMLGIFITIGIIMLCIKLIGKIK